MSDLDLIYAKRTLLRTVEFNSVYCKEIWRTTVKHVVQHLSDASESGIRIHQNQVKFRDSLRPIRGANTIM